MSFRPCDVRYGCWRLRTRTDIFEVEKDSVNMSTVGILASLVAPAVPRDRMQGRAGSRHEHILWREKKITEQPL